jgi:hypothetical protein
MLAPGRGQRSARRAVRAVLRAALLAGPLLAIGPVGAAAAAGPSLTLASPADGSVSNNQTPTFTGTTDDFFNEEELLFDVVTVRIYSGPVAEGSEPVQKLESVSAPGPTWSVGPAQPLPAGTYTAQAEQTHLLTAGHSLPVTFTVDTTAPGVTLTSPADGGSTIGGSQVLTGASGTERGDLNPVTVQLFPGSSIGSQQPLEAVTVPSTGGLWSATVSGLNAGTYTARAEQSDDAGNVGTSAAVTFTLLPPPPPQPPAPPQASFKWFPSTPVVGEPVTLASSSTDSASPLVGFAWAFGANTAFNVGKQVLTETFTTPGDHVVRLRVAAADGLSSVATATLHVVRRPLTLMAPFPVVRIAGVLTSSGVNIGLMTAQAPEGARVRVTCRGRGCPTASESRLIGSSSGRHRAAVLVFRRFERSLSAGVILEIKISKPGSIGKYTRFTIRHGKLPRRVDACLDAAGVKPIACPTS